MKETAIEILAEKIIRSTIRMTVRAHNAQKCVVCH